MQAPLDQMYVVGGYPSILCFPVSQFVLSWL